MSPLIAAQFLTRVPIPGIPAYAMRDVARAQAWFPAVGLLLGLALLAVDRLAMRALPGATVDVLLVVAMVALTGALHLEGLADAADGLFGGDSPPRRLEIMRDVHAGSYAIIGVAAVLALKWAGLNALPPNARVEAIVLAPCLARFGLLVAIAAFPYARAEGLGAGFREALWPAQFMVGSAVTLIASIALLGAGGLPTVAFVAAIALVIGAYVSSLVGGMTGDTYGAVVEVCEALVLLFIAALANRGWMDAWAFG